MKSSPGVRVLHHPEGFYVPPFDAELFNPVRGKKVDIVIGHHPRKKHERSSQM